MINLEKIKWIVFLAYALLSHESSAQIEWHSPMSESPQVIQGRFWSDEIGTKYQRFPERAREMLRKPVWNLSYQTAGLYVKFMTDANSIDVRYGVTGWFSMPHMPSTGVSGVDLYAAAPEGKSYWCAGKYQFSDTIKYHYSDLDIPFTVSGCSEYTLYLPLYNGVKWLEIGVPQGSRFKFLYPSKVKPIVVYGTSIAQGACASRPGMAWTNILQRELGIPVINLAFSGNGQLDESVFRLLSEIDASLFIIDCMPNMVGKQVELIRPRLKLGLHILHESRRSPVLLVDHDGYMGYEASPKRKERFEVSNREQAAVYEQLKDEYSELHYLTFEELGLEMDSQVDGTHATDLGMRQYADAYLKKIRELLNLP